MVSLGVVTVLAALVVVAVWPHVAPLSRFAVDGSYVGRYLGPIAYVHWPVGHADCVSYVDGELCVTPTALQRPYAYLVGGGVMFARPTPSFGPWLTAHFDVTNQSSMPVALAVNADNTQAEFSWDGASYYSGGGASPLSSTQSCPGVPSGVLDLGAHRSSDVCLRFSTNSGASTAAPLVAGAMTQLTFAGITEWASNLDRVTSPANGMDQVPLVYLSPQPTSRLQSSLDAQCWSANFSSTGCGWPANIGPFQVLLETESGATLHYGRQLPPSANERAWCKEANDSACVRSGAEPSDGPIILVVRYANSLPYSWRTGLRDVTLDVQYGCTRTGCSTARLLGQPLRTAPRESGCSLARVAILPAASRRQDGELAFCFSFDAPRGSVADELSYVKYFDLPASKLTGLHLRPGQRWESGAGNVPYMAGTLPSQGT